MALDFHISEGDHDGRFLWIAAAPPSSPRLLAVYIYAPPSPNEEHILQASHCLPGTLFLMS